MPEHPHVAWDRLTALALNTALWVSILWLAERAITHSLG
jgi:hypothetical protein